MSFVISATNLPSPPKMLDQEADPMFYIDKWAYSDATCAKAYHYRYCLDLFGHDISVELVEEV